MVYNDSENARQEQKKGPHRDYTINVNEFNRVMRSAWMPRGAYEVETSDGHSFGNYNISEISTPEGKVSSHVTFIWGIKGKSKMSHPLSFHMPSSEFGDILHQLLNKIKRDLYAPEPR